MYYLLLVRWKIPFNLINTFLVHFCHASYQALNCKLIFLKVL